MKTLSLFASAIFAGRLLAAAPEPQALTPQYVDGLLAEARRGNPALLAAEARADAGAADAAAVRTWDDPTVSLGVWGGGPKGWPASQQGNLIYGIDQKLPFFGRPDLKRRVAAAEATRDRLSAERADRLLRRDIETALVDLALADREAGLEREDLAWLRLLVQSVDSRYRVGRASQVDWLRSQTDAAAAADELTTRELACTHGSFALNRLLGRDPHAPWPALTLPENEPALGYTPGLVAAALSAEPDLKVMREESASSQAVAELSRRDRLPEIGAGAQAWQYSGDGGLRQAMLTVNVTVPWLNRRRNDAAWRRDRERARAADLAADDYAQSVREELHHHVVALDGARRQVALYRDQLIPLTEQTLRSAQAAWEHGAPGAEFRDVLDAHRMLIADRLALARAQADEATRIAQFEYMTGAHDAASLAAISGPAEHVPMP